MRIPIRRFLLSSCFSLSLASLIGITSPTLMSADMAVPAPMAMPDDTVYAVAVIPDLMATLGHIEAVANLLVQGKMPAGSLKMDLGAMLGDPGLANFTGKPVVIVVGPGAPMPSFALLIPAKNPQTYIDAGENFGMVLGKEVDGLAVLTQTPDGEILGEKIAKAYPNLVKDVLKGDARILIAPDKLVQTYGGMIGMMAQMAAGQAKGVNPPTQIMTLGLAGVMAMTADIATVQIDLCLDPAGIFGQEITITAKSGSAFAAALVAPGAAAGPRAASRLGPEPTLMSMNGRVNWSAILTYYNKIVADLKARPETKDLITDDFVTSVKSWGEILTLTGDSAFRLREVKGTALPYQWEGLYACENLAKAEAAIDSMIKLYVPGTSLSNWYKERGISMMMTKAERTSPSGVPIHHLTMTFDENNAKKLNDLPPSLQLMVDELFQGYEIATTKNWLFMAQDPKQLDALIAGTGKGMNTAAERSIGVGRQVYADLDFISIGRAAMTLSGLGAMMPAEGVPEKKPYEPITMAATVGSGRALIEVKWQLARLAEAFKAIQGGGPDTL